MKGQNIGGEKNQLYFISIQFKFKHSWRNNGELNWIIENNKVQTLLKIDLLTEYC